MVSKLIDLNRYKLPLLTGAMLFVLSTPTTIRAADESPNHKPDAKAWKMNREKGQKALENKDTTTAETFFTATAGRFSDTFGSGHFETIFRRHERRREVPF